jgi:predicted transposase/invertase (TIGR01784 family)
LYSGQLTAGDRYEQLQPVISICFLEGILFPQDDRYHLRFQLLEEESRRAFTDHLEVQLFPLPNFVKTAEELADTLDAWLYFLNNGKELDPENLPGSLRRPEIEEAVEVLEMLTQDEVQREVYEAREKARRDAQSWQSTLEGWKQEADRLKQEAATSRVQGELVGRIHSYEEILGQNPTPDDQLASMSLDELNALLDGLRARFGGQ